MTSDLERRFETLAVLYGLPPYVAEYRFAAERGRRFRFDVAWVDAKLAVEIDGGQWQAHGGRHARDCDKVKANLAAAMGWRVMHFSGQMLDNDPDGCMRIVREALDESTTLTAT